MTRKDLAEAYEGITGTRPPTKWNTKTLTAELDKLTQPTTPDELPMAFDELEATIDPYDDSQDNPTATPETEANSDNPTVNAQCCGEPVPQDAAWELSGFWYCSPGHGCKADKNPDKTSQAMRQLAQDKPKKQPKSKAPKKVDETLSLQIHIHQTTNPKKGASKHNYDQYREGMTVQEYIQAIKNSPECTRKDPRGDIRWDTAPNRKFISLHTPEEYSELYK